MPAPTPALENAYLRAYRLELAPGAHAEPPAGALATLAVWMDAGTVAGEDGPQPVARAGFRHWPGGTAVRLASAGPRPLDLTLVCVDAPWRRDPGPPSLAGVALHQPVHVDDTIEAYHVSFPPGSQSGWHHHPRPGFAVIVAGGRMRVTSPDGRVEVAALPAGQVLWHEVGLEHQLENVGDTRIEIFDIEWR